MELEDIPQVLEVDRESYTLPWPASAYRREVLHNRNARYLVLRHGAGGDEADLPKVLGIDQPDAARRHVGDVEDAPVGGELDVLRHRAGLDL